MPFTLSRLKFFALSGAIFLLSFAGTAPYAKAQNLDIPEDGQSVVNDVQPLSDNASAVADTVNIQLLEVDKNAGAAQIDIEVMPAEPVQSDLSEPQAVPMTVTSDTEALLPMPELDTANESEAVPPVFYDANDIVPQDFAQDGLDFEGRFQPDPGMAQPENNPASKFIVIQNESEAGSQKSRLVAASRAVALGRYDSAMRIYDEVYSKNPRDPRVLIGRANVMQKLGRTDAAIQSYQELLDIDPDNLEARINMLGLMTARYPSVAMRNLMILHKAHPGHAGIVAQIAVASAELGSFDDALEYFGMASAMEPRNANHIFNMAVVADRAGNIDQAILYYEQALEADTIYGAGRTVPREAIFERLAVLR